MAKRKKNAPAPLPRLTPQRVRQGWSGPNGSTIRLVRPDEITTVQKLATLTGIELEEQTVSSVTEGAIGKHLLAGLDSTEALQRSVVEEVYRGDMIEAVKGLTVCLVVQNREGAIIGTLVTVPPGTLVEQVVEYEGPGPRSLLPLISVVKIKAVAVAENERGHGYATALIKRTVQMYWQAGFQLIFGEFGIGSGLETFYSRFGFTILEPGEYTDIGTLLLDLPIHYGAGPGEQFFYRWRR